MFELIFVILGLANTFLGFGLFFFWFVIHQGEYAGVHPDDVPPAVEAQRWKLVLTPFLTALAMYSAPSLPNLVASLG